MGVCCAKQNAVVADVPFTHEFAAIAEKDVSSPTAEEVRMCNRHVPKNKLVKDQRRITDGNSLLIKTSLASTHLTPLV